MSTNLFGSRAARTYLLLALVLALTLLTAGCGGSGEPDATEPAPTATQGPAPVADPNDKQPPVIMGVLDKTVYVGDAVSYRADVTVTDDVDPAPTLEVDSSAVDLSTPGVYFITYIARDASGNETRMGGCVTVQPRPANAPASDNVYDMADEVLETIITDSMTIREKVRAVYLWTREHIDYVGTSEKNDWLTGAQQALTTRQANCYSYFCVVKLLLEQMGIPNIDVVKVPTYDGDSNHYWSLVSIDGGETYYHVDATPQYGQVDEFCLVTDAFIDAKSAVAHNRDKTLYPATPKK